MAHHPITTIAEWDAIDREECTAGYMAAERGDPEPGANHTRSYHHGWRMRMMDLGEIKRPIEHMRMVREVMDRDRIARGVPPRGRGAPMPDIAMCLSSECQLSRTCHRHPDSGTHASKYQTYFAPRVTGTDCNDYWPKEPKNV